MTQAKSVARCVGGQRSLIVVDGNITLELPACLATEQPGSSDGRHVYSSHGSRLRVHLEHVLRYQSHTTLYPHLALWANVRKMCRLETAH